MVCATALVGPIIAQDAVAPDNVGTRTTTLLALEWMETDHGATSGIMLCLTALDKYTAHGADYDPSGALAKLKAGISQIPNIKDIKAKPLSDYAGPDPFPGANGLYDKTHADGKMPDLLARATTRPVDANDAKRKKALFEEANTNIKDTYRYNLAGLDKGVDKVYRDDPARALYQLLKDLLPSWSDKTTADAAAKKMDVYRTCYLLDKSTLFGLVHTFLQNQ